MKKVFFRSMLLLMMAISKLKKAINVLYLCRVDKKSQKDVTSGEHVALTLIMNDSHLSLDVGKTILNMHLAPLYQ